MECTKNCKDHIHMTGGKHRTDCALSSELFQIQPDPEPFDFELAAEIATENEELASINSIMHPETAAKQTLIARLVRDAIENLTPPTQEKANDND